MRCHAHSCVSIKVGVKFIIIILASYTQLCYAFFYVSPMLTSLCQFFYYYKSMPIYAPFSVLFFLLNFRNLFLTLCLFFLLHQITCLAKQLFNYFIFH